MLDNPPQPAVPSPPVVSPVLTDRRKLLIAGLVFALALGYLMYIAFQGAAAFYLSVGELVDRGEAVYGEMVRVNGKLVPGSFERQPGEVVASFALTDGVETLDATYSGPIPDLFFNEHSEIVLEGEYQGSGTAFEATNIIVKCPTKYQEL